MLARLKDVRLNPRFRVTQPAQAVRRYHDDAAFGHRVPVKYELPDCESLWISYR
jgi:hypothetical protein